MNTDAAIQTKDDDGFHFEQWCREEMAKCEIKWNEQGKIFAWFSKEPSWERESLCWLWLDDPTTPCRRIFRFSLNRRWPSINQ
jgi:hypothetical protein